MKSKYTLLSAAMVLSSFLSQAQYITTYAGNGNGAGTGSGGYKGDGGQAYAAELSSPAGVATYGYINVYITDMANHVVRKVDNLGNISTYAGTGTAGYTYTDTLAATSVKMNAPYGIVVDAMNTVFVSDQQNNVVYKITNSGIMSIYAGVDTAGYSGDGGPANMAKLNHPSGLSLDPYGNLYIGDASNNVIRRVATDGTISTFAGNGYGAGLGIGHGGYTGDGGAATAAKLNYPEGVAADAYGNVYIADAYNNVIRKVNASGKISTYAGNGIAGFSGDGGSATAAMLLYPAAVATDGPGNVYIADHGNNNIRKVGSSGTITSVAGNHASGYFGDYHMAVNAQLNGPSGINLDGNGLLYIADQRNNVIRLVGPSTIINGVKQLKSEDHLNIYPNPTRSKITIGLPETTNGAVISLIDMTGRILIAQQISGGKAQSVSLDLGIISAGRYVVKVNTGDNIYHEQIVVTE